MSSSTSISREECCPPFDPSKYQDGGKNYELIRWKNKPFVVDGTRCLFHVPLAFGKAVMRAMAKIERSGAQVPTEDFMVLSDCSSPWWSDVLVSTSKEHVEGAEVTMISGLYLAKAFEGDYSNMGKWLQEINDLVKKVRRMVLEEEEKELLPLPSAKKVMTKPEVLPNAKQVVKQEEEDELLPNAKQVAKQEEQDDLLSNANQGTEQKEEHEPLPNARQVTKKIEEEDLPNAKKMTEQKEEQDPELLPNAKHVRKQEDEETIYFYYPTCPKCAKKYGKNYVVIFARISEV
jgi:hypothetical protein